MSIGSRRGSDLNPLDVHDEAQARWLRALIWPDETERFDRLRNALAAARSFPVDVVAGDAVALVAGQIESVPAEEHPVVITTWVLTYLPPEHRRAFVGELQNAAGRRPVSWVCLEHPSYCEGLPWPDDVLDAWGTTGGGSRGDTSMSGNPVVVHDFDAGRHTARWIATAHPHGRWINWHPTTASTSAAEYRGA